ncbi:chitinase [Streptomyces niveiscabiei]|uniref:chitinase n=1 Tax=Streptomyces niveiscabiei TaxID=164115 RepID=UPI0029B35673|nr:chitinase [Streptomyces niveiscabiei]MDX3383649.1 chitinase [Streptomyces niveiscabiei]
MRSLLVPLSGLTCLFTLAVAGCSSGPGTTSDAAAGAAEPVSSPSSPSVSPVTTGYAPYVSATEASANDSAGSPATYNLAFVISDGSTCTARWNGTAAVGDTAVKSRIAQLTASGSSVRVSFGGASGKELATVCADASELAAAYGAALDAAGSARADFDIEGATLTDSASVALRSRAIAQLQEERPELEVTFTLPVMPSGLDADGLALLASANKYDVRVAAVNIMTMNYGETYTGNMADYAITSATATHTQLKSVFGTADGPAWHGLALTSMIGVNDIANETFTLADAARLRSFAEEKGIAWVSMWSTFRDQQCVSDTAGRDDAATNCSGVRQNPGAFGRALAG